MLRHAKKADEGRKKRRGMAACGGGYRFAGMVKRIGLRRWWVIMGLALQKI
jgi:hypothetical protein